MFSVHLISPNVPFDHPVDVLVELCLHKVALKPVAEHLYSCIHASRTEDGTFTSLQSNLRVLEKKGMENLGGSAGVGVPDSVTLERIQQRWASVHEAYSPNKKVQILLKVCKTIYHSMSANASSGIISSILSLSLAVPELAPCLSDSNPHPPVLSCRYSVWSRRFPAVPDMGVATLRRGHLTDRHRLHDGAPGSHTATGRG